MKRILVFCKQAWFDPSAHRPEHYAYAVFSRIASKGHFVAWACAQPALWPPAMLWPSQHSLRENIHIARLGWPPLYRASAPLFLSRLERSARRVLEFDCIVDCITRRPLALVHCTDAPIVPVVFGLHPRLVAPENPPGPYLAATVDARLALRRASVPDKFIVTAHFPPDNTPDAWDEVAQTVLSTLEILWENPVRPATVPV